mgnify:CR=1 FL=1
MAIAMARAPAHQASPIAKEAGKLVARYYTDQNPTVSDMLYVMASLLTLNLMASAEDGII